MEGERKARQGEEKVKGKDVGYVKVFTDHS